MEKQFTLQDCLSQSLAHRRDPEGTAEEMILPREVEADGISSEGRFRAFVSLQAFASANALLAGVCSTTASALFGAILCA